MIIPQNADVKIQTIGAASSKKLLTVYVTVGYTFEPCRVQARSCGTYTKSAEQKKVFFSISSAFFQRVARRTPEILGAARAMGVTLSPSKRAALPYHISGERIALPRKTAISEGAKLRKRETPESRLSRQRRGHCVVSQYITL